MRGLRIAIALAAVLVGAVWAQASPFTVTFGDDATYWSGWTSTSSPYGHPYSNSDINNMEHVGVPDLFGGSAAGNLSIAVGNGYAKINSIKLTYNSNVEGASVDRLLKYGDLFLDVNSDKKWDYVVHSDVLGLGAYTDSAVTGAKSLSVKSFASGIGLNDSTAYMLSNNSTTRDGASWSGYVIRYDHPWALNGTTWNTGTADGTAAFTGWQDNQVAGSSTYTFSNPIDLVSDGKGGYDKITIGFAVQCANDVLYQPVDVNTQIGLTGDVPEPASFVVWTLIAGLSVFGVRIGRKPKGQA